MAYDVERLKAALPYCKRLDFECHTDPAKGTKRVVVTATAHDDIKASIECPDMPPTTDDLILVVHAAFNQTLHPFVTRQHIELKDGNGITLEKGKPEPPVLLPIDEKRLPGLMPETELKAALDTDGIEVTVEARQLPAHDDLTRDKLDEAARALDRAMGSNE
jgi:hypothetical protein